ncbi:MAG: hypothetical protein VX498_13320, partial [Myxococcota bacterium]|nr:hypothetical protein [Myxococcota bacterium]
MIRPLEDPSQPGVEEPDHEQAGSRPLTWPEARQLVFPALTALVVGLLLYRLRLLEPGLLVDETWYDKALEAAAKGTSAGETVEGWYYPDLTARLGAWLSTSLESHTVFVGLRLANLVGCALVAALVGALFGGPRRACLVAGLVMIVPPVNDAVSTGNVSGLLTGLIVCALVARSSFARSFWLIPGFLFKPYALGLI